MKFLSIKETVVFSGKSESSIKRIIAKIKRENPEKYNDLNIFKFEKLPTGHDKIFINQSYINDLFNVKSNDSFNKSEHINEPLDKQLDNEVYMLLNKTVDLLHKELNEKNIQIERLQISNQLLLMNNEKVSKVDLSKRKWWQIFK